MRASGFSLAYSCATAIFGGFTPMVCTWLIEVTKNQEVSTVEFLVDGDTKVEGKLATGSHATVEYRSNSGKNVAVHVVVTPASGMGLL